MITGPIFSLIYPLYNLLKNITYPKLSHFIHYNNPKFKKKPKFSFQFFLLSLQKPMPILQPQQVAQHLLYQPQNQIDINLTYGDDGGQQQLMCLTGKLSSYVSTDIKEKQEELLKEIQSKEEVKKDIMMVFKFQVQTGRERESFEFIEKGLDQYEDNQNISALQMLFRRPKTSGRIQLKQGKGYIYVIYRFYQEHIEDQFKELEMLKEAGLDLDLQFEASMKGTAESSKRSFTAVKPDYFNFRLRSQKLTMPGFLQLMEMKNEVDEAMKEMDLYRLFKNLHSTKIHLKFNSIRKIMSFYNRVLYQSPNPLIQEDKQRQLPLSNKGIFKNSVSMNLIIADKLAFQAELKYRSEEILLRVVARVVKMLDKW